VVSTGEVGFSTSSLDFHLGGRETGLPFFPRLNLNLNHHHPPPALNLEGSSSALNMGFNNPLHGGGGGVIQGMGSMSVQSSLASSIESLSSLNQDLHWKLQQQRLAMLFGEDTTTAGLKDNGVVCSPVYFESQVHKLAQPILGQSIEISKPEEICAVGGTSRGPTEWLFGGSYNASVTPTPTTTSTSNGSNNWTRLHAWNDVQQQYGALP